MNIELGQRQEMAPFRAADEVESADVELISDLCTQIEEVDQLVNSFRIEYLRENKNAVEKEIIRKLLDLDICNAKKMDFDTGILGEFQQGNLKSNVAEYAQHFIGSLSLLDDARFKKTRNELISVFLGGWDKYKEALNALISSEEDNNT
jgi:hypothetical protein